MSIIVSDLHCCDGKLSFKVETPFGLVPDTLYFDAGSSTTGYINESYDCALVALIPLALMCGENIRLNGPVSIDLYENALEAIALFRAWYPSKTKPVSIFADLTYDSDQKSSRVMSFYSGGVDSLFNIAGRIDDKVREVDACVLVHGMDISIENKHLWNEVQSNLAENIKTIPDIEMICVETNARLFQPYGVDWTSTGFGPILGAISNFLSKGFGKAVIGSYGLYHELEAHASGPLIDRFWSSERVDVIHYSPRYNRLQKILSIKNTSPQLLKHLRVCWKNPNGKYNCGVCEKCLRTKTELHAAQADSLTQAFGVYDLAQDLKYLRGNIPVDSYTSHFWRDLSQHVTDKKVKTKIQKALMYYELLRYPNIFKGMIKKWLKIILNKNSVARG